MLRKFTKHSNELINTLKNNQHTSYRMLGDKYNINPQTISTCEYQRKHEKARGISINMFGINDYGFDHNDLDYRHLVQ